MPPRLVAPPWSPWRKPRIPRGTLSYSYTLKRLEHNEAHVHHGPVTKDPPAVKKSKHGAPSSRKTNLWRNLKQFNSAVVIPASIPDIQPHDLIQHIPSVRREEADSQTFLTILATPSFAPWLSKSSNFLENAVLQAYQNAPSESQRPITIHTLSAVVDQLPAPESSRARHGVDESISRLQNKSPDDRLGYEGIAAITLPAQCSRPSLLPNHPEKGAIDFIMPHELTERGQQQDIWRVPLSNTVFQTGSPTTMFLSKWSLHPGQQSVVLESQMEVSHHGLDLAVSAELTSKTALNVPLMPLTFPRIVQGCMGNIIRGVLDPEQNPITAAAELEEAVPQFFVTRQQTPQPVHAWALVMPQHLAHVLQESITSDISKQTILRKAKLGTQNNLLKHLWRNPQKTSSAHIAYALANGARLHRVLSGGGGWGKKAGLISLDPVPIADEFPIRMEDATSEFDGPGDFLTALKPVVQDGDAVQFYIFQSPSQQPAQLSSKMIYKELRKLQLRPQIRAWGLSLGTIPSTKDSMPGQSWQHRLVEIAQSGDYEVNKKAVAVFENIFGALSEGGLTLTRKFEFGNPKSSSTTTTMIDAPFSRFWAAQFERDPLSKGKQTKTTSSRKQRKSSGITQIDGIPEKTSVKPNTKTNVERCGARLNFLAYNVYTADIALRSQLAKMIFYRYQNAQKKPLKNRLVQLQAYDKNLYWDKPHMGPSEVRDSLHKLELRSLYSRILSPVLADRKPPEKLPLSEPPLSEDEEKFAAKVGLKRTVRSWL